MAEDSFFSISGNIVDVTGRNIFPGTVVVRDTRIEDIIPERTRYDSFICPGLVDSHVHIESSMLTPHEFSRVAVTRGTIAAVCDPHEIANVLGLRGVQFMLDNARTSPFTFAFGAPSCVPATPFESSGASITHTEIDILMSMDDIYHLSEVMNFPAVVAGDTEIMARIEAAKKRGKPVDGHAPGLRGNDLKTYVSSGITTDHEATTIEEALEKIGLGMKILIREGSAARDFEALNTLISQRPDRCMLCSDDKHPDDLINGHMDLLVRKAIALGHDPLDVLRCASMNPVLHYGLATGLLRKGDPADFIVVDSLKDFNVLKTYVRGMKVSEEGRPLIEKKHAEQVNIFHTKPKLAADFSIRAGGKTVRIITAEDGSLLTGKITDMPLIKNGFVHSDPSRDILKIAVVNRYQDARPALGLIRGFGLHKGAIATSVAHDSHNIIAVGVSDQDISAAVNAVIENRGGCAVVCSDFRTVMPLPIAGLMSDGDGWETASRFSILQNRVRELGSPMKSPFITLSFMALLVIPHLKLSDKGLFDGDRFAFTGLFC